MILIDTNILIDVLSNDPQWADWSIAQLEALSLVYPLAINPMIYSEMSLVFSTIEALDKAIEEMELQFLEIPKPALFLAARAFSKYRKEGGVKNNILGDFFIGAHAAVASYSVLTRDPRRIRRYFPTVRVLCPE